MQEQDSIRTLNIKSLFSENKLKLCFLSDQLKYAHRCFCLLANGHKMKWNQWTPWMTLNRPAHFSYSVTLYSCRKNRKTEYGICWTLTSKRYLNPHLMEPERSSRGHLLHTHQCTVPTIENFAVYSTASLCMQRRPPVSQGCHSLCVPYTAHVHW